MPIDITVDGERVTVPLTQPDLDRVCRGKDTFLDGFIPGYVQKVDYLCSSPAVMKGGPTHHWSLLVSCLHIHTVSLEC